MPSEMQSRHDPRKTASNLSLKKQQSSGVVNWEYTHNNSLSKTKQQNIVKKIGSKPPNTGTAPKKSSCICAPTTTHAGPDHSNAACTGSRLRLPRESFGPNFSNKSSFPGLVEHLQHNKFNTTYLRWRTTTNPVAS